MSVGFYHEFLTSKQVSKLIISYDYVFYQGMSFLNHGCFQDYLFVFIGEYEIDSPIYIIGSSIFCHYQTNSASIRREKKYIDGQRGKMELVAGFHCGGSGGNWISFF